MGRAGQKAPASRALKPRDAATLVLVDRSGEEPRILMGRRRASQVFLPNKFVFPGGRLDRGDWTAPALDDLREPEVERLLVDMKGNASTERARALALAAIREMFEEAGIVLGEAQQSAGSATNSRHPTWRRFHEAGFLPKLSGLEFFARAITPPARPRRYDTRFFLADASAMATWTGKPDEELISLDWFTLTEARALDLPNITRAIIEDLASRLRQTGKSSAVPYYSFRGGAFRRELIG